jgi:hypothetical protein
VAQAGPQQLSAVSGGHDTAAVEYHDPIGIDDRGQGKDSSPGRTFAPAVRRAQITSTTRGHEL